MVKDPRSPYRPGRRGMEWLKVKRALRTIDVVVTAVEWGHGKRHGVLSDYTFSVRDGERLRIVGKAYSGLTDKEIAEMTEHFLETTVKDLGRARIVRPDTVIEVAFDQIQRSDRHDSGYAMRFPRIVRLRPDKPVAEIDTLETVRAIAGRQSRGARPSISAHGQSQRLRAARGAAAAAARARARDRTSTGSSGRIVDTAKAMLDCERATLYVIDHAQERDLVARAQRERADRDPPAPRRPQPRGRGGARGPSSADRRAV